MTNTQTLYEMTPNKRIEQLPRNNQYVVARFPNVPFNDVDAKNNEHKWVVVKFVRGLSIADRKGLADSDERKKTYRGGDQDANNKSPYYWKAFGNSSFLGQSADYWCALPII